jgi:type II secretory pathway component PulF
MLYLVAIVLPPVALLFNGQLVSAILNFLLCCVIGVIAVFTWGLGIVGLIFPIAHAWVAIARKEADRRDERLVKAMAAGQAAANKTK